MAWLYANFHDTDIDKVVERVLNYFNGLSPNQKLAAKIAASNQKNGQARGVIFFPVDDDITIQPAPSPELWIVKSFKTNTDYVDELYVPANDYLIDLQGQSESAAFWAKVTYTNYHTGDATLEIWHPQA